MQSQRNTESIPMAWHHTPGPLETSLEYVYNRQQGANREIVALHPNDVDWLTACRVLKTALAHISLYNIVVEDRVRGLFPICHLDLHFGNLLSDEEYSLTGVIDWSDAQADPIEQLSVCPALNIFPGLNEEKNGPIIEFKTLVVQFVKGIEEEKANEANNRDLTQLSTYMASASAEITCHQYMASPKGSLWAAKRVAKPIYGKHATWEQLKKVYGCMSLL
ncbi:hypothetical protein CC86DRAFT_354739 [Ophiobolus disseminans]|uniref:Aminoglycoside phosphotransferase domain-containing protein n=1 Tax=Ophiobolus disseminans TaxID=1469910 RepID=A0A6A6ZS29_9PLEO|nr:hypothetical protein CC86DRAFT_354739 [Ophiobolus disseminans]